MSEVKEVDVKDIEPLFKDHFSPLFTAQESENGPPRPIFPMASSRDPSSGSGTQPDGLDYGPNVNPKAWSPKLPLTPPKTTIDISNTPPNEQTLPETEKVQVSQDDSDMEDEYLSSDDEVYSDEDGLEAINAADEDDEAARLALTSMLVEFGGI
ncbi:hypothetical protein CLU79DRAFT_722054 [Phycomyces nitens]|nr:hypothetical protein CLU79DRAFT_722054 [Phycomyces nitens]